MTDDPNQSKDSEKRNRFGGDDKTPAPPKGCKSSAVWLILIGIILAILLFQYKIGL